MSFLGGLIQALLTDVAKDAILSYKPPTPEQNRKNWIGCLWFFGIVIVVICFISLFIPSSSSTTKKKITERDIVRTIKVGDSIFVRRNKMEFYKKGMIKLNDYQQREIKYQYDKKEDFIKANTIYEKFFFKNRTSFIGTCLGIDTVTNGNFIMIKPSNAVTHPPKPKDKHDWETRKWYDEKYDIINESKLSKQFYVRASDITLKNNDKIFR